VRAKRRSAAPSSAITTLSTRDQARDGLLGGRPAELGQAHAHAAGEHQGLPAQRRVVAHAEGARRGTRRVGSAAETEPQASARTRMNDSLRRIPVWLWLLAPLAIVAAQIATKAVGEETYRTWMRGELGVVENLTVVFLLGAFACAVGCWRRRGHVRWRLFGPSMLVVAAGLFFFAGEEASWGQHWLGFAPPESIAERNDQGEFNLHNDPLFEKFLDQLPRLVLTLAALVGGVLAPLMRRFREPPRDFASASPLGWAWPPLACIPAALLALTVSLPEKLFEAAGREVPYLLEISAGETKEYMLALFLLVYLLALRIALGDQARRAGARAREPAATAV
jgi:hypothetical protein